MLKDAKKDQPVLTEEDFNIACSRVDAIYG